MSILDWGPLSRIRRHHALEHATLTILARRSPAYRMAGYSDASGFWLVGGVPTEEVYSAVEEALARLGQGEHGLAIHPHCGTNFVASGLLSGIVAWLAMLDAGSDWRKRLERLPIVVTLATVALILAQPLGPLAQARVTTSADPKGMRVISITRQERGEMALHRILTRG